VKIMNRPPSSYNSVELQFGESRKQRSWFAAAYGKSVSGCGAESKCATESEATRAVDRPAAGTRISIFVADQGTAVRSSEGVFLMPVR